MTSATKTSSAVHLRYAGALLDLAEEGKVLAKVEKDLAELAEMVRGHADLSRAICSPLIDEAQKFAAVEELAKKAKFQQVTINFLGVLSTNGRLSEVVEIVEAFNASLSKKRGEVAVSVSTAQDLTAKQIKDLQALISKGIGAEVVLKAKVEPSILGGMIVTVGSHMIDDSIARKLERLRAAMSKESNENVIPKIEEVG